MGNLWPTRGKMSKKQKQQTIAGPSTSAQKPQLHFLIFGLEAPPFFGGPVFFRTPPLCLLPAAEVPPRGFLVILLVALALAFPAFFLLVLPSSAGAPASKQANKQFHVIHMKMICIIIFAGLLFLPS